MQPGHQANGFGRLRNFFWPIHSIELKKVVPMFCLFFLVSFVYNLLRNMKVTLILTASDSGAKAMPFLKIGAVLPGAILLTYIFISLISRYSRSQVFYMFLAGFMAYFALFLTVLYPQRELLQLDTLAGFLEQKLPLGFHGLIAAIRHLNLTIFYVLSEMWSGFMLSMLLWGFANEVTHIDDAKRFYATFALGANASGLFSGRFASIATNMPYFSWLPYDIENQWIFLQVGIVLFIGIFIIGLYYYLSNYVYAEHKFANLQIKTKQKISLRECFSYSLKSRYVAFIVIIVVAYNIVYNLSDFLWTSKVQQVCQTSKAINAYTNQVSEATSYMAIILAFLVSGNVIRFYGWKVAGLITPLWWGLAGFGFFFGSLLEANGLYSVLVNFISSPVSFMVTALNSAHFHYLSDMLANFITNPANFILFLGSLQIGLGRACKYTVFDESKEIAFVHLSKENQRKAKAVVDGIATRFGKSGGAVMIILMLLMCNDDVSKIIPYLFGSLIIALVAWLYSVIKLGEMIANNDIDLHKIALASEKKDSSGNTMASLPFPIN
jgi:AAA family ATP:ADP antiporter